MVERLIAEHSVRISRSALSAWLRGHGGTFKKVRARTGAGSPRRPEAAPGLVRRPARSRSGEARVHRRDRPLHKDGSPAWKSAARRALPGRRAAWPLEDHDLHRSAAADGHDSALRLRRRYERQRIRGWSSAPNPTDSLNAPIAKSRTQHADFFKGASASRKVPLVGSHDAAFADLRTGCPGGEHGQI